ncbi:MerR family transcriptional regulator [Streptomyces lavendulae]|uniref:MerR family transcriptional regulator n=1 Tax=Streptomyces lavendulae TaxID=1914 RepID=UPI0033F75A4A
MLRLLRKSVRNPPGSLFANPVRRLSNGRRAYHEEDLEWLAICTKLRSSGMSLALIRQYIEPARQGPGQ